ncbi:substrate-binding periplasmic protein [Colwellia piezophila]|uniref:substrate-binding periplasmic protein n=1 Tax=Colwellia piezophila TaxID=211668 RepID=UPI00035E98DF|nr:transporter substrate-binding domain-containing protein [Colwellia piezophila]
MNKVTIKLLQLSLIFLLSWSSIAIKPTQAKALTVVSDEWCPYVCDDRALPGFLVEIVHEIARDNALKIQFSLMPLARALKLAKKNKVDILLALTPQHIADFQLQKSQLSFGGLYNDFYVRAGHSWRFQSMTHLSSTLKDNAILGTINGYHYGEQLNQLLRSNTEHVYRASGYSPLKKLLKMLQMSRLDILIDSRFTVQYQLSKLSESPIIYAGTQGDFTPLFLGFSSLLSKEQVQLFDSGLMTLRQSGKLDAILAKYALTDWQQQAPTDSRNMSLNRELIH